MRAAARGTPPSGGAGRRYAIVAGDVGAAGAVVGIDGFGAAGQAPARWHGFDSPPGASGAGAVICSIRSIENR